MNDNDDIRFLSEITHLYYEDQLTQAEIAKKLFISRSLVSKLLQKARKMGMVEIIIHDEDINPYRSTEHMLKDLYGLEDVVCIGTTDPSQIKEKLGSAGAKYLARRLPRCKKIAIASSTTVYETAISFSYPQLSSVTFVPLSGGLDNTDQYIQANHICSIFARSCGGNFLQLHVPIIINSLEAKRILEQEPFIANVLEEARNADLALVGIGNSPKVFQLLNKYYFERNSDLNSLKKKLNGDISFNYYDKNGKEIDCDWNRHVISLNIDEIKKIPTVVGIAGGPDKLQCIYTAVSHKMIDVLITDINTAQALLSMKK
ncbi:MAG: sugar-binding transcriptional regulator [Eubacteriaceae bacterium]|jgi:deoxyribonucleoside regulator